MLRILVHAAIRAVNNPEEPKGIRSFIILWARAIISQVWVQLCTSLVCVGLCVTDSFIFCSTDIINRLYFKMFFWLNVNIGQMYHLNAQALGTFLVGLQ